MRLELNFERKATVRMLYLKYSSLLATVECYSSGLLCSKTSVYMFETITARALR